MTDAGQHVEQRTIAGSGVRDAVGRDQRHAMPHAKLDERLRARLFVAVMMPLQFDEDPLPTKDGDQAIQHAPPRRGLDHGQGSGLASGQADQPPGVVLQVLEGDGRLPLGGAELRGGEQLAEMLIPGLGLHQEREATSGSQGDLRAHDRAQPLRLGGPVEPGRAVHAVAVHQRRRGIAQLDRAFSDRFGQERAFQKAERALGVQFDVLSHTRPR